MSNEQVTARTRAARVSRKRNRSVLGRSKTTDFAKKNLAPVRREVLPAWARPERVPGLRYFVRGGRFDRGLFIGMALALFAGLGWAAFALRHGFFPGATQEVAGGLPDLESRLPEETAEAVIARFLEAERWEDLLPLVRAPEAVRPLMEEWYLRHPYRPSPNHRIESLQEGFMQASRGDGLWMVGAQVRMSEGSWPRLVPLERVGARFRVDWECAAGYQPMDVEIFESRRPREPVRFRVNVRKDDYYNFAFADRGQWASYRIFEPHSRATWSGFARRGSAAQRQLSSDLVGEGLVPCILGLRFLDDESEGCVEIAEWVQREWIIDYGGEAGGSRR